MIHANYDHGTPILTVSAPAVVLRVLRDLIDSLLANPTPRLAMQHTISTACAPEASASDRELAAEINGLTVSVRRTP